MRHRSPTNSRPWENLELRRDYFDANPACELQRMLRRVDPSQIDKTDCSAEVHHIFGGFGKRPDLTSNLIVVCRSVHSWLHKHPDDGRIACLKRKDEKGELSPEEFLSASGRHLRGFVEYAECQFAVVDSWRQDLARKYP